MDGRQHYVYFLYNNDPDFLLCKIGYTNSPKYRLFNIREEHGYHKEDPTIEQLFVFSFDSEDEARAREKFLHNKYESRNERYKLSGETRERTEWFRMKKWQAQLAIGKENNREFSWAALIFGWLV